MDNPKGLYILTVEDAPSLANAIHLKLTKHGIQTVVTNSGKKALEIIDSTKIPFDGIWLDFDILEINGLEFMREYVKREGWEKCPVLIVSNTGDPTLIHEAIKLGAKKWIVKAEARLDDIINEFVDIIEDTKTDK